MFPLNNYSVIYRAFPPAPGKTNLSLAEAVELVLDPNVQTIIDQRTNTAISLEHPTIRGLRKQIIEAHRSLADALERLNFRS